MMEQHHEHRRADITHRVNADKRVVLVTIAGDVSIADVCAARDAVFADPAYVPGMDLCVECRALTAIPTADEIRGLALSAVLHRADVKHGRIAIVAPTPRSYEAADLFELFTGEPPDRLAVFTDLSRAGSWLAVGDAISDAIVS